MTKMLCLAALLLIVLSGCKEGDTSSTSTSSTTTTAQEVPAPVGQNSQASGSEVAMPSGLKYVEVKVGDGGLAENGMNVSVHYTGWLTDGTKFDSSLDRGQPITFQLGTGAVIRGWDEGLKGMRVGGKRKLTIPPDLAYGPEGRPPVIPPNSTLVFDVELVSIQ